VEVPAGVPVLEAHGGSVTAGFWNVHVHFTEPHWARAQRAPASVLDGLLANMLTSHGFTSVVDLGSDPRHTYALRRRVAAGDLAGPTIYSAGMGLYPPRGLPYYVGEEVPWYVRWIIPKPRTPGAATRAVRRGLAGGADVVKLFTGSYIRRGTVLPMPEPIARAAVEEAHGQRRTVFAHPSNLAGTLVALHSGVDVLAHAPDSTEGIDEALIRALVGRRMVMVPTLQLFATVVTRDPGYLRPIHEIVRTFRRAGGELWFGTDVGFMTKYATEGEFRALVECGLDGPSLLAMLTTRPAARFAPGDRGTIAPGQRGDLVLLDGDPYSDPMAFARVRATIREGRVLWDRAAANRS
jgi:imidazolonepropionase-like amidohydrolase